MRRVADGFRLRLPLCASKISVLETLVAHHTKQAGRSHSNVSAVV